jgi:hypothetical protein
MSRRCAKRTVLRSSRLYGRSRSQRYRQCSWPPRAEDAHGGRWSSRSDICSSSGQEARCQHLGRQLARPRRRNRGQEVQAETGADVEFITGGTIDRLNKAKLAKGNPESDITFTTSHVGWLYANDGLFETLDLAKIPNAKNLVDQAKISPFHIGTWAYVYTIGYRPDLIKGVKFESWADLWKPELKGKLAAPDFDPSHIIAVAAMLSGGDAASWEKGQASSKS